jgi:hypothetical protein
MKKCDYCGSEVEKLRPYWSDHICEFCAMADWSTCDSTRDTLQKYISRVANRIMQKLTPREDPVEPEPYHKRESER